MKNATCIDCKHALEVREEPGMVVCVAHLEYYPADKPATCAEYGPRTGNPPPCQPRR